MLTSKKKQTSAASAKVVDGKLVLSLPDARAPVVWQMDLDSTKASALEVRHNDGDDTYTLILKTPKGEKVEIATFKNKALAVDGLMAASGALENAHGLIRGAQNAGANDTATPQKTHGKGHGGKWFIAIAGIIGLFILLNIWASLTPRPPGATGYAGGNTSASIDLRESSGVPVSADDFLRGQ